MRRAIRPIVLTLAGLATLMIISLPAFSQDDEGLRYRNEAAVQAFGSFVKTTTNNGVDQSATNSALGNQPLFDVKAYALVDLRVGVETKDGAWKLFLWGRNVGNTYYWTSTGYIADTITRFTGMPATYGVALSYRYR